MLPTLLRLVQNRSLRFGLKIKRFSPVEKIASSIEWAQTNLNSNETLPMLSKFKFEFKVLSQLFSLRFPFDLIFIPNWKMSYLFCLFISSTWNRFLDEKKFDCEKSNQKSWSMKKWTVCSKQLNSSCYMIIRTVSRCTSNAVSYLTPLAELWGDEGKKILKRASRAWVNKTQSQGEWFRNQRVQLDCPGEFYVATCTATYVVDSLAACAAHPAVILCDKLVPPFSISAKCETKNTQGISSIANFIFTPQLLLPVFWNQSSIILPYFFTFFSTIYLFVYIYLILRLFFAWN